MRKEGTKGGMEKGRMANSGEGKRSVASGRADHCLCKRLASNSKRRQSNSVKPSQSRGYGVAEIHSILTSPLSTGPQVPIYSNLCHPGGYTLPSPPQIGLWALGPPTQVLVHQPSKTQSNQVKPSQTGGGSAEFHSAFSELRTPISELRINL